MGDDANWDLETRRDTYGLGRTTTTSGPSGVDLQTQLNRAYLSGNGAEVERVLSLIADANLLLPPKSRQHAA